MAKRPPLRIATALLAGAVLVAGSAYAQERRGAGAAQGDQAVLELLGEINRLQTLVQQLRGELEVQTHQLEQLRGQQRQALADFDRRLRELEERPGQQQTQAPGGSSTRTVRPPQVIVTPPTGGDARARAPRAESAPPPASAPVQRASRPSDSEQQAYDAAFNLMKQGLYAQAAVRFREFLTRFPEGALADNAQYWIGEAAYVTRDFRKAIEEFGKVLASYPDSAKVPDAMLKIGYTYYELGEFDKARETLSQVTARYASTAVAKSAELRLEKIAQEGR